MKKHVFSMTALTLTVSSLILSSSPSLAAQKPKCPNGGEALLRCNLMNASSTDNGVLFCKTGENLSWHKYWLSDGRLLSGEGPAVVFKQTANKVVFELSSTNSDETVKLTYFPNESAGNAKYEGSQNWHICTPMNYINQ